MNICAKKLVSRKFYFTFLEVLIALAILAAMTGVIALNVRGLYFQQETLDEMNRVGNLLRTAQELMMITNLDSKVHFTKDERGVEVSLSPISAPAFAAHPLLRREPLRLKNISSATFDNAIQDTLVKEPFFLPFISRGFMMYPGVLEIKGSNVSRSIVFSGSPSPIALQSGTPLFPYNQEHKDYIQQVIQQTAVDVPFEENEKV